MSDYCENFLRQIMKYYFRLNNVHTAMYLQLIFNSSFIFVSKSELNSSLEVLNGRIANYRMRQREKNGNKLHLYTHQSRERNFNVVAFFHNKLVEP